MNRHGAAVGAVAGTLVGIGMATAPLWVSIVFVLGVLYLVGYGAAVRSGAIPAPPVVARIIGGRPEPGCGDPVASLAQRWARDAVRDPDWWERQGCLATAEALRGRSQRPRGYLALTTKGGGSMLRLPCGCRVISHPAYAMSVDPCAEHSDVVLIVRKDCGCQSWEMGDGSRQEAACARHQQLGQAAHVRLPPRPTAPPPPPPAPRQRSRSRGYAAPTPPPPNVPSPPATSTRRKTVPARRMDPEPEKCGAAECVVVHDPDTGERLGAVHSGPGSSIACPRDGVSQQ